MRISNSNKTKESHTAIHEADRVLREGVHLLLLDDARRGLEDIAAGRTEDARAAITRLQKGRGSKTA